MQFDKHLLLHAAKAAAVIGTVAEITSAVVTYRATQGTPTPGWYDSYFTPFENKLPGGTFVWIAIAGGIGWYLLRRK